MISRISWATLALRLIFGGILITGCDHPTASDATKSDAPPPMPAGSFLRADPNPVLEGNPDGKTTIIWDTGSNDVGEVYAMEADKEKLFASGAKGSQEAASIKPGSTEFRLYTQAGHKLLAKIKVTMSPPAVPPTNLSIKPVSSPSP
jgi:hypothetical protein